MGYAMQNFKTGMLVVAIGLAMNSVASAQNYPTRPIRVIGPTVGGGVDVNARIIAPYLSSALGQQIVIENKGGAGGILAAEAVIRAQPDGYTLLVYGPPVWINPLIKRGV